MKFQDALLHGHHDHNAQQEDQPQRLLFPFPSHLALLLRGDPFGQVEIPTDLVANGRTLPVVTMEQVLLFVFAVVMVGVGALSLMVVVQKSKRIWKWRPDVYLA